MYKSVVFIPPLIYIHASVCMCFSVQKCVHQSVCIFSKQRLHGAELSRSNLCVTGSWTRAKLQAAASQQEKEALSVCSADRLHWACVVPCWTMCNKTRKYGSYCRMCRGLGAFLKSCLCVSFITSLLIIFFMWQTCGCGFLLKNCTFTCNSLMFLLCNPSVILIRKSLKWFYQSFSSILSLPIHCFSLLLQLTIRLLIGPWQQFDSRWSNDSH